MKQVKIWMVALILVMGLSFASCISNNDNGDRYLEMFVKVSQSMYGLSFEDNAGVKIIPTNSEEVSKVLNFDDKVAYIGFTYNIEDERNTESSIYAVVSAAKGMDASFIYSSDPDTKQSTAAVKEVKVYYSTSPVILGNYLILGIDYYFGDDKVFDNHKFALVYDETKTTAESTEINLYLRHTDGDDEYKTRESASQSIFLYGKAFDISRALSDYKNKTKKDEVKIVIEADINELSEDLEKSLSRTVSSTYKYPTE